MDNKLNLGNNTKKKPNAIINFISNHKLITLFIVCILVFILTTYFVSSMITNREELRIQQEIDNAEAYKQKMFSESHTKLQYYIEDTATRDTVEASAILIAHVLNTGCSKGYEILKDSFDEDSMKYLQDFLTAKDCEEYKSPPVVCLSESERDYKYLVRTPNNSTKYLVYIHTYNDFKLKSFSIELYTDQDLIE